MAQDAAEELGEFFDYIWQDTNALVYVPTINQGEIKQAMYRWPKHRKAVIEHILSSTAEGADAYFSPAMFSQGPPKKENVLGTHVLWADFDGNFPTEWDSNSGVPEPSLRIQTSSESNVHAYWHLGKFVQDVKWLEERNRAISYQFHADTSGWDANQFLRPPRTTNFAYGKSRDRSPVSRVSSFGDSYTSETFNALASPKQVVDSRIKLAENLPALRDIIALEKWPEDLWTLFNSEKDSLSDRSGALVKIGYLGAENGFSDEQLYVLIENADKRWEKYTARHDRERQLLDIINRVRQKIGYSDSNDSVLSLIQSLQTATESKTKVVYNFGELLAADVKIDWAFKSFLARQGLGVIAGEPGAGKTQMIIQMGMAAALGRDFITWQNVNPPSKVLFLSLEMFIEPLQLLFQTMLPAYNDDEIVLLSQNFMTIPMGTSIYLDQSEGQQFIDSVLTEYQPDLILIDSLSQTVSNELSDEKSMLAFIQYLVRTVRSKHKAAVVFVHHTRKQTGGFTAARPTLDDIYGSRFFTAALDMAVILRKTAIHNQVQMFHVKNRLGPEMEPFDLYRQETLTYIEKKDGISSDLIEGKIIGDPTVNEKQASEGPRFDNPSGPAGDSDKGPDDGVFGAGFAGWLDRG